MWEDLKKNPLMKLVRLGWDWIEGLIYITTSMSIMILGILIMSNMGTNKIAMAMVGITALYWAIKALVAFQSKDLFKKKEEDDAETPNISSGFYPGTKESKW